MLLRQFTEPRAHRFPTVGAQPLTQRADHGATVARAAQAQEPSAQSRDPRRTAATGEMQPPVLPESRQIDPAGRERRRIERTALSDPRVDPTAVTGDEGFDRRRRGATRQHDLDPTIQMDARREAPRTRAAAKSPTFQRLGGRLETRFRLLVHLPHHSRVR